MMPRGAATPFRSALRAYIAASARARTSAGLSSAPRSANPAEAPTRASSCSSAPAFVDRSFERGSLGGSRRAVDVPQQHGEFIAAHACNNIRCSGVLDERRRDHFQDGVARGVTVPIVHRLEAVEIDIDQRSLVP